MIDTGDTAWILMSTALVMLMLPGLALFYGGLVRAKNVLSTIMHSFFGLAIVTVVWVIVGFSLAFGDSIGDLGIVGDPLQYLFFSGVGMGPQEGSTIPFVLFATFQMTFAIITPALIVGAFAERIKFSAMLLFSILWFTFSYLPICHMAWGGKGALFLDWGVLDFAGGTVVHINAGIAGLVTCVRIPSSYSQSASWNFPCPSCAGPRARRSSATSVPPPHAVGHRRSAKGRSARWIAGTMRGKPPECAESRIPHSRQRSLPAGIRGQERSSVPP